jgi:intracellular sulfur oxidation DsrE/DsrF family protein
MSVKRSAFLAASAALAATARAGAREIAVPGGTHFVERKADWNPDDFAAAVGRDAQIRQVYEAVSFKSALLNNVKNSFNGLQFGFGYAPGAIAIALAAHGPSSAYSYGDYVWKKYRIGEFFDIKDAAGAPLSSNVFLPMRATVDVDADPDDEKSMYQDTSLAMLQRRGLIVLTCHTAVEEQARGLVKRGFAPPDAKPADVAADILEHLIPGAVVVPSMVSTIAVLQAKYRYTYITPVL